MAVLGVGGVFFKSPDPDAAKAWYRDVLEMEPNSYGGFDFLHAASADAFGEGGRTIYAHFEAETPYFDPSPHPIMVNLMVDDLDAVLARLAEKNVPLLGDPETYDYGRFAWVLGPDGVKIELWQPLKDPTA